MGISLCAAASKKMFKAALLAGALLIISCFWEKMTAKYLLVETKDKDKSYAKNYRRSSSNLGNEDVLNLVDDFDADDAEENFGVALDVDDAEDNLENADEPAIEAIETIPLNYLNNDEEDNLENPDEPAIEAIETIPLNYLNNDEDGEEI